MEGLDECRCNEKNNTLSITKGTTSPHSSGKQIKHCFLKTLPDGHKLQKRIDVKTGVTMPNAPPYFWVTCLSSMDESGFGGCQKNGTCLTALCQVLGLVDGWSWYGFVFQGFSSCERNSMFQRTKMFLFQHDIQHDKAGP